VRSYLSPNERLTIRLEALGFAEVEVHLTKGTWRADVRRGAYRWEGSAVAKGHPTLPDGYPVTFGSWDRMTDCARRGVTIASDGVAGLFLVSAAPRSAGAGASGQIEGGVTR